MTQIQAIIALVLFLGTAGGGFYAGLRWDKADVIEARNDLANARLNETTLRMAADKCNASVDGIKIAGDKLTAAAQALVDARNKARADDAAAIARITAIKSTSEKCLVADTIMTQAFQ